MASKGFSTVVPKIKAILDGLVTSKTLGLAFDYLPNLTNKFPSAFIDVGGVDEKKVDTITNQQRCIVDVYVMFDAQTPSSVQFANWLSILDDLASALRSDDNMTLGGEAINVSILGLDRFQTNDTAVKANVFVVRVGVDVLHSTQS